MIWVQSPDGDRDSAGRVAVACGTRIARDDDPPGDFEIGARVVSGPFEPIGVEGRQHDPRDDGARAWNTVAIVRIRPEIVRDLRGARAAARDRVDGEEESPLKNAVSALLASLPLDTGWRAEGAPPACGFSSEPRPRNHTTLNHRTGRRVGLHLDSWDQLPPRQRWQGSNRICVNLGTDPRALLFVPKSASQFADDLASAGFDSDRDPEALVDRFGVRNLARRYLEVFPEQTIVRVFVGPGEAYIAPTENLIHDGYAPAGSHPDLSLTLRGRFAPSEDGTRRIRAFGFPEVEATAARLAVRR